MIVFFAGMSVGAIITVVVMTFVQGGTGGNGK